MHGRLVSQHPKAMILAMVCAIGTVVVRPMSVSAQALPVAPLDRNVIATVDRVYPGFIEILETCDARLLSRLADVLVANPSTESLEVLIFGLQACPGWYDNFGAPASPIRTVAGAARSLPLERLSGVLVNGTIDQRAAAASVLSGGFSLLPPNDRQALEPILIAALSAPAAEIREQVAGMLRRLDTPAGNAALARALDGSEVSDGFYFQATGRSRTSTSPKIDTSTFRPDRGAELASLLVNADPDVRSSVAFLLRRASGADGPIQPANTPTVPMGWFDELIRGLMPHRTDLRPDVRVNVLTILASAIRATGAPVGQEVVRQLGELLVDRDVRAGDFSRVVRVIRAIADRSSLPMLERGARRSVLSSSVRRDAAQAYAAVSAAGDPEREMRRLLWEQPDTALETRVLAEGKAALPLVWQALETGSAVERRAAATLLAWYPDVRSIRPILAALDRSPGAVMREQLLFDLNVVLVTDGSLAGPEQANALAPAHLRWVYEELARQTANDNVGPDTVLSASTIAVFPDPGIPDSVPLSGETQKVPSPRGLLLPTRVAASAVRSDSPQAFIQGVSKAQYGVAFHRITTAEGVARVATTFYAPNRGVWGLTWISLYRQNGDRWERLPVQPITIRRLAPGLQPAFQRDYGSGDPAKVMDLDLAMERIRVDVNARMGLGWENGDWWSSKSRTLNASHVPLLERYRRSDVPSVRYTAEFELALLTGQPNVELWIDALARQPERSAYQQMALRVLGTHAATQVAPGRQPQGRERDELVNAAMKPQAVNPQLVPSELPRQENIRKIEVGNGFAIVEVTFRGRGYSMVFERRDDRWIYLCPIRGWLE